MSRVTPLRRQYLQIKAQHPDALVFFRLGDFYETFDEDAEIAARELDIVLTSRPVAKNQRVPMAGVPHHTVDGYIARLIEKGYRVALADQVGETTGRGLVPREVTRVVTPGTIVEPTLLDEKQPNYLAAITLEDEDGRTGLAYADITTGEFATAQVAAPGHLEELVRLRPRECLVSVASADGGPGSLEAELAALPGRIHVTPLPAYRFELGAARQVLLDHFGVATLDGFGCAGKPLAIQAAGAIIHYLRDTQKGALPQIVSLHTYAPSRFMTIDAPTRRNLELTETIREGKTRGSLLGVLDHTLTPMGGRLLRSRLSQPLLDCAELNARLDEVETFFGDAVFRGQVRRALKSMPDLERLANRVVGHIAVPRDLSALRKALARVPGLIDLLIGSSPSSPVDQEETKRVTGIAKALDPCEGTVSLIAAAIADDPPASLSAGGSIRPGFSAELDGILAAANDAKAWIAGLEREERARTGIKSLKVGFNKVFGYYIEVTKANLDAVPESYIRKQTLVNAERYITPELKEYESLILNAEERQAEVEARLFREVCEQVASAAPRLLNTARTLGRLDVAAALSEVAVRDRYVRPSLAEDDTLHICAGRHPVVERTMGAEPFTPNDLLLDQDQRILIITGPNMAGKSVYLRQNAIIVLMAQMGSFVPADEAHIGVVDRIFTRIGAQDEVAAGRSTFMVEMVETANILHHATARSLLILDEIGRGTSTYDGLSIAWAVVEYLHNHPERRARTLFATHYHELIEIAETLPAVRNFNLSVAEEGKQVVFLHQVVPGGADRSYGIHVAQLAGVPRAVIRRAEELLGLLESGELRPGTPTPGPRQLKLFSADHPVVSELREMDVSQMTPLEAINRLYALQREANEQ